MTYFKLFFTNIKPIVVISVATLFLRKSTRFRDKKTLDYKIKLAHSENDQKMHCSANH